MGPCPIFKSQQAYERDVPTGVMLAEQSVRNSGDSYELRKVQSVQDRNKRLEQNEIEDEICYDNILPEYQHALKQIDLESIPQTHESGATQLKPSSYIKPASAYYNPTVQNSLAPQGPLKKAHESSYPKISS